MVAWFTALAGCHGTEAGPVELVGTDKIRAAAAACRSVGRIAVRLAESVPEMAGVVSGGATRLPQGLRTIAKWSGAV